MLSQRNEDINTDIYYKSISVLISIKFKRLYKNLRYAYFTTAIHLRNRRDETNLDKYSHKLVAGNHKNT